MASCEGSCKSHRGEVKRVHVVHIPSGHEWGEFDYCEAAIDEAGTRHMRVTEIPHPGAPDE